MDVTSVTNATRECIASVRARSSWLDGDGELPWDRLAALAEERRFAADGVLTRQFAPARHLFLVAEGTVRFQLRLEEGNEDLDVGERSTPWTAVGWSGFRDLRRYATTVVCTRACRTLRFEHGPLAALFEEEPRLGVVFLEGILRQCFERLADMRARLTAYSQTPVNFARALQDEGEEEAYNRAPPPLIELLRRSAFFAPLDEEQLRLFAGAVESRYFCRGEPIVQQGSPESGLWVLATGRVALNYSPPSTDEAFALRTISEPGSVVAIAGLPGVDAHGASVVATRDCTVYRIDTERLGQVLRDDPSLALALVRRVLWLASMHLRAARALFISRRFEKERLAVGNLLEQSCTQLSVHSPLHTVPHLLGSQLTVGEAFAIIERMAGRGDALERSLAELCQEMLRDVRREHEFFEALRRVYHAVVTAPEQMPARDVRKLCARGFQQAFRRVRYVVEGEENLPPAAGQIFIFNHLKNHEHNTLPNNFQLTLDSHFVSAMILDRRYGDGGIRVVRHSRGSEYGHQAYYDRLGHIAVYTHESDRIEETPEERQTRQNEFFETAGGYLRAGTNLILSPEGTSYWTEDSPGPFKPGAFRLAASVEPEPLIVPVAVAHFDRRIHSTVCAAVIKRPFRVSDVLPDPRDRERVRAFLVDLRKTYHGWVEEARRLAGAAAGS
ncbi:MAG: cyclic nucleotide-binding domain-containing protein [Acidobacteria bacterium]|nr:cyclic nucleotide-binding domain-containing protein [Acidobacteriota bacterium]